MKKIEDKRQEVYYKQILAALMTKFTSLSELEYNLLVTKVLKDLNLKIKGFRHIEDPISLYFYTREDGTILFQDKFTLDTYLNDKDSTLREYLLKIAGWELTDYFENFDVDQFRKEYAALLDENKKDVLENANVLMICDRHEDYDALINYGFQNVDYFKSIIRANNYFKKHPNMLDKYHIVISGSHLVQGDMSLSPLQQEVIEREGEGTLQKSGLYYYSYTGNYSVHSHDYILGRSYYCSAENSTQAFDLIIDNTLMNQLMKRLGEKDESYDKITDYINPDKIAYPTRMSEVKILFLNSHNDYDYISKYILDKGLNIKIVEDNNFAFFKYLKEHLGDYDIIIASKDFSNQLTRLGGEIIEQCKDTGRRLVMAVTYKDDNAHAFQDFKMLDDVGEIVDLDYIFVHDNSVSSLMNKRYHVLRRPIKVAEDLSDHFIEYNQSKICNLQSIIDASLNYYNDFLIKNGLPGLGDIDLRSADEVDSDYLRLYAQVDERKRKDLEPLKKFDEMRTMISNYLWYVSEGYTSEIPDGVKIAESESEFTVKNVLGDGRVLCVLTFPKYDSNDKLRTFKMQTITKKMSLSSPQLLGIHTGELNISGDVPPIPSNRQFEALEGMEKRISSVLGPINSSAKKRMESDETSNIKSGHQYTKKES